MKRVLFASNYGANDTTSWLRAFGPFSLLQKQGVCEIVEPKLNYVDGGLDLQRGWWVNWRNWVDVDVCFMHRPYGIIAAAIMSNAKMHGVPLWVDHDDDLLNIPLKNPYYHVHREAEEKFPSIEMSYREADVLTCSGKVMYQDFVEKYNRPDAILITTGLHDRLLPFKKPFKISNKVGWRGSTSHMSDLEHFETQFREIFRKHRNLYWHWFGIDPRKVFGKIDDLMDAEVSPQRNLFPFIKDMCDANCTIHVVPLEDNKFNRVKSNLAWLDATLAGSVVLGPPFEEWECLHDVPCYFADGSNFAEAFSFINSMKNDLEPVHNRSWEYIQDCLLTSHLNKQRIEILKNL